MSASFGCRFALPGSSCLAQCWESQEICASGLPFGSCDEETHCSLSAGEWFAVKIIFFVVFLGF